MSHTNSVHVTVKCCVNYHACEIVKLWADIMVKHLIRLLLHNFFKERDFYNLERPIIKNVTRILPVLNRKSKKSWLNFFLRRRILIETKMPKVKSGFYAVHTGFKPGVYHSWEECEKQIKKYPNAKYKKFTTLQEAEAFVKEGNYKKVFGNSTRETPISKNVLSKQKNYTSSPAPDVSNGNSLKVWTDGSSINNGQDGAKAGIGVYWGENDPRNVSERLPGPRQTNNRAEIMAVIRALETCPDNNIPLEIRTDSQYVINAYKSWIPKWEKNKWKTSNNKDVENKGLFQRLMKLIRARNAEVTIEYVQAHVGVKENEEADQLAKLGASMDVKDDPYDYGEDNDEMKCQHTILQYFQTITDESSPLIAPSIVENSQILLNNLEYNN